MRVISKFMRSQPGYQTIAMHILSDISRSKGNHKMKLGQLIEHNLRNFFVKKKPYIKYGRETITRPFLKKLKLSLFLDQ